MGFEKDYNDFMKAIINNEIFKVEEILSQSDNRNSFLHKALSDFGYIKMLTVIENFRALGLRKELILSAEEYKGANFDLNKLEEKETIKIVRTHEKNKMSNEKYHLSGSSFTNQTRAQEIA